MNSTLVLKNFRVFAAGAPERGVKVSAFDETEAVLTARENYPALARAARVVAVAS